MNRRKWFFLDDGASLGRAKKTNEALNAVYVTVSDASLQVTGQYWLWRGEAKGLNSATLRGTSRPGTGCFGCHLNGIDQQDARVLFHPSLHRFWADRLSLRCHTGIAS
jgi:hypothetical protein